MIPEEKIHQAVEILKAEANPLKIILFGSYARGNMHDDSDLDFLIVKKDVKDRRQDMVKLRRALSRLRIPVDILVVSSEYVEEWKNVKGNVIYHVIKEGLVLYG